MKTPVPVGERGRRFLLFAKYPKETAIIVVLTAGGGIAFYTYTVYMQKLLINTAGFDKAVASQIMTLVLVSFMCLQPLAGWISDKVGRKSTLMASFGLGALLAVPVLTAISSQTNPVMAYLLCLLPLVVPERLHLAQCHRKGRTLSHARASARRRVALRIGAGALRGQCGDGGAVVQESGQ